MIKIINMLRSIIFNLVFAIFTVVYLTAISLLCLLPTDRLARLGIYVYCRGCLIIARIIMGIRYEVRGAEKMPQGQAFIFACKHQSNMDPLLAYVVRPDLTALAKKELFDLPVMGHLLAKIGVICIDRKSRNAHAGMPEAGRKVVESKRPLLVYPEGTRVPVGEHRKLKSGTYHLHKDNDLAVYPIASNAGMCWSKGFWHNPGLVIYEVGDAILGDLEKRDFQQQLNDKVVERSNVLMQEAGIDEALIESSRTNSGKD